MERESFQNEEIAQLLNSSFISVKVDREERPDVDKVYMTFVQVILERLFYTKWIHLCQGKIPHVLDSELLTAFLRYD